MANVRIIRFPVSTSVLWLWLLSLAVLCTFEAQDHPARGQAYIFRPYRQSQGLSNLSVNSLAEDRQGFLWVATENGVYRFLGSDFQRSGSGEGGIVGQDFRQVYAAPDGKLWAGGGDLYRWTGQAFEAAANKRIVVQNDTSLAWEGPGRLFVLSGSQLYRLVYDAAGKALAYAKVFSPDQVAAHPQLAQLGGVAVVSDGTLWMACGRMLCSWRGGALREWGAQQGVPPDAYRSILGDHRGGVWAVGQKHVLELPGATARPSSTFLDRALPPAPGAGVYERLPIACDPEGRIIVSLAGGVARWNGSGWQIIGSANGLSSTHLTAMLFDRNGSLWLGSSGHGLHHWIGYAEWEGWTDHQGLPSSNIWSIGPITGNEVSVGTENGPAIVNAASGVVSLPSAQRWVYGQVTGMIRAPGRSAGGPYLVSTASGALVRMEGGAARATLVADLQAYLYGLMQDASGRTFAIAGKGVFDVSALFDAKPQTGNPKAAGSLAALSPLQGPNALLGNRAWIMRVCQSPDGTVWFGSENGIVRLVHDQGGDHWSRPLLAGLPNPLPELSSLVPAGDGGLWAVVGDSSIWHLVYEPAQKAWNGQAAGQGRLKATALLLPRALQTISAVQLFVDPRGWLWVATDDGLLVWNGSAWRQLTQEDGLIWNDLNAGNMASGPDGSIWVGTSGGLSRLLHPERVFATPPPLVSMIRASLGTQLLPLAGAPEIPWSRQDLCFQFAAPNSLNRADLVFFYRLRGLETDWIESRDETAHFETLPAGDYVFEVFAEDRASGGRSARVEYRLRIRPPWWRTPWFYTLCALALVGGAVWLFRLRTRHLLGQRRRLEAMVLERTAQLEASREKLSHQATHDGLTGLLNRVAILEAFGRELARARGGGSPLTLVLADIDHFKVINDTYGHLAGDEALRRFSAALAASIRPYDYVGRYGGEEFLLVLVGVCASELESRLSALHRCITDLPVSYAGAHLVMHCSLGVAQVENSQGVIDEKQALDAADHALYRAKRAGRNRFIIARLDGKQANEVGLESSV